MHIEQCWRYCTIKRLIGIKLRREEDRYIFTRDSHREIHRDLRPRESSPIARGEMNACQAAQGAH